MKRYAVPEEKFQAIRAAAKRMTEKQRQDNESHCAQNGFESINTEYDYWLMETTLIITALRQSNYIVKIR
jgi:hypothetical protein